MGKKRVHELSKELGLDNKTIIEKLKKLGIEVASHSSTIDDVDASNLIQAVERERGGAAEKKGPARVIIRRRHEEPVQADVPHAVEPVEEPVQPAQAGEAHVEPRAQEDVSGHVQVQAAAEAVEPVVEARPPVETAAEALPEPGQAKPEAAVQ
ncbi:MAG: translation initiation factor IF-2 N-terminal domain-containing protein, partial [Myxococcota bacterium]